MNAAWFGDDPDPLVRPSMDATVAALLVSDTRYAWVRPTDDESDAAEVLRHIAATHRGPAQRCDNPDEPRHCNRTWGPCTTCGERWPCSTWSDAQVLAVEFLGRAQDRYAAHADEMAGRAADTDRRMA